MCTDKCDKRARDGDKRRAPTARRRRTLRDEGVGGHVLRNIVIHFVFLARLTNNTHVDCRTQQVRLIVITVQIIRKQICLRKCMIIYCQKLCDMLQHNNIIYAPQ